jgi:cell division protein FtsB
VAAEKYQASINKLEAKVNRLEAENRVLKRENDRLNGNAAMSGHKRCAGCG